MTADQDELKGYASPPFLTHEIDPTYFEPLAVDPIQARDVVRRRKAERAWLLADRAALSVAVRQDAAERIALHLEAVVAARFGGLSGLTISAWWPIKAELNLRHWLTELVGQGGTELPPENRTVTDATI